MLNTISNNTHINTPAAGIIQKSNPNSFMITIPFRCQLAYEIFSMTPKYNKHDVTVLQVLLMNENYLMIELIKIKDL